MKCEGLPAISMGRNKVSALPERLDEWRHYRTERVKREAAL